jgi:methylmalonyl-CoA/ethylmalonyl-CoA epimerase
MGNGHPKLNLHHVGYVTKAIDQASEIYVRRYGYEILTPIMHDPLQTALVQFLKLAGDSSYLEFVAPDGPDSKLTNVAKRGGGLNHLCYTSGPLEETIAHLGKTKLRLISDPAPGVAFAGRRICWLLGADPVPIELVERRHNEDLCVPGIS